jgi:hypothetical protein
MAKIDYYDLLGVSKNARIGQRFVLCDYIRRREVSKGAQREEK